jgi:DNA-directed RNA polymerase II subunit RPB1
MPFTQSNAPVRPVKEIQFGILSPEDIVCLDSLSSAVFVEIHAYLSWGLINQKAYSVAKIEFPEVNDENGKPRKGGLMDPMMGSESQARAFPGYGRVTQRANDLLAIDRNTSCETCGEGMSECPGHFGHIELARPIYHPGKRGLLRVCPPAC